MSVKPLPPSTSLFPPNLRDRLPNRGVILGGISPRLVASLEQPGDAPYEKAYIFPSDPEWGFVWQLFHRNKPPSHKIRAIYCIHHPQSTKAFNSQLAANEEQAKANRGSEASQRAKVFAAWEEAMNHFNPFRTLREDGKPHLWDCAEVLPLWCGGDGKPFDLVAGAALVFPERDIHFTDSPHYAVNICGHKHLLLSWVSTRALLPVTLKDEGGNPICNAVAVSCSSRTLPRYWVELQPEDSQSEKISRAPQSVRDLVPHIFKALENPAISADKRLWSIICLEFTQLLRARGDDALSPFQRTLFDFVNPIAGKVKDAARRSFIQAALSPPKKFSVEAFAFGAADWRKYFGDVGEEPPLPANIEEILCGPCPFWSGKKVHETHRLTLVPATVNGQPLTLDSLEMLIQSPQGGGKATKYENYWHPIKVAYGNISESESHWVLMPSDVPAATRGKTPSSQRAAVAQYVGYKELRALEVVTVVLMEYVKTGARLYAQTYTRCQEMMWNCRGSR